MHAGNVRSTSAGKPFVLYTVPAQTCAMSLFATTHVAVVTVPAMEGCLSMRPMSFSMSLWG